MKPSESGPFFRRLSGPIGSPPAYFVTGIICLFSFALPLQRLIGIPPVCIFRRVTGAPCPGCGLTRALVAAAHLNIDAALSFHLFGPLLFVLCLTVFGLSTAQRFFDVRIPWPAIERWSKWPVILISAAWLAWAVHRAFMVAARTG